jgi:oligo-1,6-glucosidase
MLRCFDTIARDNARTPVQWNDSPNAGFTTVTPWINVNPNYTEINAEAALADPNSVFYYYQKLISLRHTTPIIVYGTFRPLLESSEVIYAYERELDGKVLTVAANWTDKEQECTLFDDLGGEELISNYESHKDGVLQPYEARVILH